MDNLKLAYLYDGDLLIPLAKGDYVVYKPSETDEFNVKPHSELTMGMIFYFLNQLNILFLGCLDQLEEYYSQHS